MNNQNSEYPYRYTGAPGLVGRHGNLKKGDIVFLTQREQSYVSRNSQRDFARLTGEEAAKVSKADAVNSEPENDPRFGDGKPAAEGAEGGDGKPAATETGTVASPEAEAEILKQEIADTAELLVDQHTAAELKELLGERKIDIPKGTNAKAALAALLAPAIVQENREAAAAADKPADQQ